MNRVAVSAAAAGRMTPSRNPDSREAGGSFAALLGAARVTDGSAPKQGPSPAGTSAGSGAGSTIQDAPADRNCAPAAPAFPDAAASCAAKAAPDRRPTHSGVASPCAAAGGSEKAASAAADDTDADEASHARTAEAEPPARDAAAPEAGAMPPETQNTAVPLPAAFLLACLQSETAPGADAATIAAPDPGRALPIRNRPLALKTAGDVANPSSLAPLPAPADAGGSASPTMSAVNSLRTSAAGERADGAAAPAMPSCGATPHGGLVPPPGAPPPVSAATPAAAAASLAQPLAADADLPEALGERVLLLSEAGISTARIELHPAELGSLLVRIEVQNDQAQVAFSADNPATRSLLQQALPQLREMLGAQGLQLMRSRIEERQRETSGSAFAATRSRGELPSLRRIGRIRLVDAYA